jgi:hypothetical protein
VLIGAVDQRAVKIEKAWEGVGRLGVAQYRWRWSAWSSIYFFRFFNNQSKN